MTERASLLESIQTPTDLKKLTPAQLRELAGETRDFLIGTVAATGGHLASNLGVVELTLALHYSLDCPRDKLIWDVGHQCYAHKILTGRKEEFPTLRQYGGLSGFPKRKESRYDSFDTGHSSTSISAALGMARARELLGENHAVVAVIGDGAMTGGMAWEALNDAGHKQDRVIIVLNDNAMSITRNVGALSAYLARLRSNLGYVRFKRWIERILDRIPVAGGKIYRWADRTKNSLKYLLVPGMYFEEMGFKYYGPIDGHDIGQMIGVLALARQCRGPVLIHAVTQKGRGYAPAQADPETFHSIGPFCRETGRKRSPNGEESSCDAAAGRMLAERARRDGRICVVNAAMTAGCGLRPFIAAFPKRCFDVGIAEQHAATMAAGMAAAGMRPVFAVYSSFLQRAYDQILHDICMQNLPVLLLVSHSGLVGDDGETHHGIFGHSYLRHMPGMHIYAPPSLERMEAALDEALRTDGPTAIIYPKGALPESLGTPGGSARRWLLAEERAGSRAALLAAGVMMGNAAEAASLLAAQGIAVDVADAMAVKPLDTAALDAYFGRYEYLFPLEDNVAQGGFGGAVLEYAAERGVRRPLITPLGYADRFVGHGGVDRLMDDCGLSPAGIAGRIARTMGEDGR